jgi:glycine dehydrogenase
MPTPLATLEDRSQFQARHIGADAVDETLMCAAIGVASRQALMDAVVPAGIRRAAAMQLPAPVGEAEGLAELRAIAAKNRVLKSFIGQGYSDTHTPGVILRNILENPAWYTAYTPYQAEISQGRMEAILNFQTLVCDLTGMAIANGSMLDEATSAAEAVTLAKRSVKSKSNLLIVAGDCHPQTIEVIQTRCRPLGLEVKVGMAPQLMAEHQDYFAVVCQYPSTTGLIHDLKAHADAAHAKQAAFIVCADLLALTLLVPPGEFGADIVVGNSQRFGMPMGCGGPHAAYLACRDEYKRSMPGRLVGVSKDAQGAPAYRLALQTREQHIRREKATSNICTAQVLPAVVASMYAVYHGPQGLKRIAERVASFTAILSAGLQQLGLKVVTPYAFDTLTVECEADAVLARALAGGANLRRLSPTHVGVALDETSTRADVEALWSWFSPGSTLAVSAFEAGVEPLIPGAPAPQQAPSSPTRSSTPTTARPRCCATSAASPTRTWRWTAA